MPNEGHLANPTTTLGFNELKSVLHRHVASWPDHRKPAPTTRYRIRDAALGAFGTFFTQSPSFLDYLPHFQQTKGHNYEMMLLGVEEIPGHH